MDIKKRIAGYENSVKKKAQEKREKYEKELQERRDNAKALEKFIADTAWPIFKEAKKVIHNEGYPCEVKLFPMHDKEITRDPIRYSIQIALSKRKESTGPLEKEPTFSSLEYTGVLKNQNITVRFQVRDRGLDDVRTFPIGDLSSDKVKEDRDFFLEKVFFIEG